MFLANAGAVPDAVRGELTIVEADLGGEAVGDLPTVVGRIPVRMSDARIGAKGRLLRTSIEIYFIAVLFGSVRSSWCHVLQTRPNFAALRRECIVTEICRANQVEYVQATTYIDVLVSGGPVAENGDCMFTPFQVIE